jgi:DNA-binding XRE family transcriptional regulator
MGARRTGTIVQLLANDDPCDRVAFLLPGVCVTLRQAKPAVARESGDDLGSRLRCKRRELGLLQKQAAERLGVAADTLLNWEMNRRQPPARYNLAIAAFLTGIRS